MTTPLLLGLAGLAILLLGALVVVMIARRMDRQGGSAPGAGAQTGGSIETVLAAVRERQAREGEAGKKKGAAAAWMAGAGIAIAAFVGILSEDDETDSPEVLEPALAERELAAGALRGLMLSPGPETPVVLIVPGSGPTDRDGNNPLGVNAAPYRMLAEALAGRNISTVRVDKHGMYASKESGPANDVTVDSYARDYRAWIDAVRAETGQSCVWLLGHSEGALMVSAAAEGREDVCGLILVAGMGRKLGPVLREQLAANPANVPLLDAANAAIDRIEAGERVELSSLPPALRPLFPEAVQGYLVSAFAADPAEQVRRASLPTLIIQGTTDIQVSMEDARLLAEAAGPLGRLETIEGMNHVLKVAPENRLANMATYMNPDLPLAPGLADAIADFVLESR